MTYTPSEVKFSHNSGQLNAPTTVQSTLVYDIALVEIKLTNNDTQFNIAVLLAIARSQKMEIFAHSLDLSRTKNLTKLFFRDRFWGSGSNRRNTCCSWICVIFSILPTSFCTRIVVWVHKQIFTQLLSQIAAWKLCRYLQVQLIADNCSWKTKKMNPFHL